MNIDLSDERFLRELQDTDILFAMRPGDTPELAGVTFTYADLKLTIAGIAADTGDAAYLPIGGKAADADKLGGKPASDYAAAGHSHEDVYLPIDGTAVDADKLGGKPASNYALASDVSALLPSGVILPFAGGAIPAGFLLCDGAALSRTSYATLFAAIGTTYGRGNGSTTFNLPDLRGEFVRGADNGRGIDSGRALGSAQGDAIRNITGNFGNIAYQMYQAGGDANGAFQAATGKYGWSTTVSATQSIQGTDGIKFDASRVVPTASDNRPRNIALNYIIKY